MSLKNDLMFPFGNPYKDRMENYKTLTALKNVVKLARDKLRYINGDPDEIIMMRESTEALLADRSVIEIERLIEYIESRKDVC